MRRLITPQDDLIFAFDSMTDFVDYLDPELFKEDTEEFVGECIKSWEELEKRVVALWDDGIMVLEAYVEQLKGVEIPEIKNRSRRATFSSDEGDEIDYEKLYAGNPNFWRKTSREEQTAESTITVVVDTTTSASYDSEDILWRGAAAIALTHHLEAKGYTVEVWVVNGSSLFLNHPHKKVMTGCRLKRHSDPLDVSTLINGVAGWYYRTVVFTMLRTIGKKEEEATHPGLGRPAPPGPADLRVITADIHPIYSSGVYSFSAARDMVVAELNRVAKEGRKSAASGKNE